MWFTLNEDSTPVGLTDRPVLRTGGAVACAVPFGGLFSCQLVHFLHKFELMPGRSTGKTANISGLSRSYACL
jgi:hypothetical protein